MALWEVPWMLFASCVILRMISLSVCGDTLGTSSNSHLQLSSELPCPDPAVISPCRCTFNATLGMDMDCSKVTSEDELREVFSSNFSTTHFRNLIIIDNQNIQSLREGDLGSASFEKIMIEFTSLSEIEVDALKGSYQTLVDLEINGNSLTSVPDISEFTRLKYLNVHNNKIDKFPNGSSATILSISLGNNHIDDVLVDAIIGMTALETLQLSQNLLTQIHPNTFTRNENLSLLDLGQNMLITIPDDAIEFHGDHNLLILDYNQITSLTYEAVSSVDGYLAVNNNNLTEVPKEVFKPLLEDSVQIKMNANPFKCGCDMAWLVINQTLLHRLPFLDNDNLKPTCSDGHAFTDLDPQVYKVMCPNATVVPL